MTISKRMDGPAGIARDKGQGLPKTARFSVTFESRRFKKIFDSRSTRKVRWSRRDSLSTNSAKGTKMRQHFVDFESRRLSNIEQILIMRELDGPAGIRTRVARSKASHDWPDYTTGPDMR